MPIPISLPSATPTTYWARFVVGFDGLKLGLEVVGLAVGVRVVGLDVVGFDVGVRVVGRAVDGLDVGVFVDGRAVDGLDVGAGLAVGVRVDGLAEVGLEVGRAVGRYNNKRRVCEAFQMRSGGGRVYQRVQLIFHRQTTKRRMISTTKTTSTWVRTHDDDDDTFPPCSHLRIGPAVGWKSVLICLDADAISVVATVL